VKTKKKKYRNDRVPFYAGFTVSCGALRGIEWLIPYRRFGITYRFNLQG